MPAASTAAATVAPSGTIASSPLSAILIRHPPRCGDPTRSLAEGVAKRPGSKGAMSTRGCSSASSAATASAVAGACSTPLRKWPVAISRPSLAPGPISGALSGVPGRSPARASTSSVSATSGRVR